MTGITSLIVLLCLAVFSANAAAQEINFSTSVEKAVVEIIKDETAAKPEIPAKEGRVGKVLYRASQAALIGALVWDMQTTVQAINNPLRGEYDYCSVPSSCGHVTATAVFSEGGWTTSVLGINSRNTKAIVAANLAWGAGVLTASHFLSKKGGKWRKVAIGLNFIQASANLSGAINNQKKVAAARTTLVPAGAFNISW